MFSLLHFWNFWSAFKIGNMNGNKSLELLEVTLSKCTKITVTHQEILKNLKDKQGVLLQLPECSFFLFTRGLKREKKQHQRKTNLKKFWSDT